MVVINRFMLREEQNDKVRVELGGAEVGGSSWRATSDAREDWVGNNSRPGVIGGVDEVRRLWMYAGVNRFNDLDMMCIGLHGLGGPSNNTAGHQQNGGKITGLNDAQARSQMSLWCMFASPLALTCDLRETPKGEANSGQTMPNPLITEADIETLTNTALKLTDLYLQENTVYTCSELWSKTKADVENTLNVGTLKPYETKVYVLSVKQLSTDVIQSTVDTTNAYNAPRYDISGRQVSENYKGISIKNGVKTMNMQVIKVFHFQPPCAWLFGYAHGGFFVRLGVEKWERWTTELFFDVNLL